MTFMKRNSIFGALLALAAVMFPVVSRGAELPFTQFNAARGEMRMSLTLTDKNPEQQYVVNIYSTKGDVFNLLYRKNRLQAALLAMLVLMGKLLLA